MKYPANWNKTVEDLFEEDRDIEDEEIQWAKEYEKDQIRKRGCRFPKNGEIYEAKEDVEISYLVHWKAPFTSGGDFYLKKGSQIKVEVPEFNLEPISVYADAIEKAALEKQLISETDLNDPKYNGYSLSINTIKLNESFEIATPNK